jgi:hypothetical protein
MAIKNVIAYFMHEYEQTYALQALANAESTESFVIGDLDESEIGLLQEKGLIVQEQLAAPIETPVDDDRGYSAASLVDSSSDDGGDFGGYSAAAPTISALFEEAFPAPVDFYSVALRGPLLEARREQLDALGVTLGDRLPEGGYKVRLRSEQVSQVNGLPFVEHVTWLAPAASAPQFAASSIYSPERGSGAGVSEPLTFDVRLQDPADKDTVLAWLSARNIDVVGSTARKIRFHAQADAPDLDELAMLPEVDRIDQYTPPELANDRARCLLGIDSAAGGAAPVLAEDGTGQIVAVADTGIDDQHPDFQGRIVAAVAHGRPGDASDPHGHGTHVAGSVLGDGSASNGQIKGVAPQAKLFFQSLLDGQGKLGGLPLDLNDLFDEAYQAGARIHNNSWSAVTNSEYTMSSEEVDEFVADHRDMLVVIAAGNEGTGVRPRKADPGYVDWLSIGSPASCKNALTVGASRSDRTDGPLAARTWNAAWYGRFPSPPIANETVSGDPESLAAFSSRGPCNDHRIKPDLVAPGTEILSTRSAKAPPTRYRGSAHYTFENGTSMAAPLVSGCAALVRQYYVQKCAHANPSAALLKATLVNSTQWLKGDDANAKIPGRPNNHQGHGRVCMTLAIPNPSQPGLALQFVDDWQTFQFTRTGQRKRYQFVLPADAPELRFCMAYTDRPARGLQNNLNLIVEHAETRNKYFGNKSRPDALTELDTDNNLESIRIALAKAGTYNIQVLVANLLQPKQDFALVVTGVGVPALTPI